MKLSGSQSLSSDGTILGELLVASTTVLRLMTILSVVFLIKYSAKLEYLSDVSKIVFA